MNKHKSNGQVSDEEVEVVEEGEPTDELSRLTAENQELQAKYLRALADYQNLQNRTNAQRVQIRQDAAAQTLMMLLPFLDNLEAAEAFVKDPGLAMIKKQFAKQLEEMGLVELEVLDRPFDPHTAEAIDTVESEKDGIVLEVLRRGYAFCDAVIRPAQVRVGKSEN
jgi:molecular chaperone GrpE